MTFDIPLDVYVCLTEGRWQLASQCCCLMLDAPNAKTNIEINGVGENF